jgi:2-keto-3-deoxy-galactonokinase
MNSKQQREQFSTTFTTKFVNLLRKHAFVDNRITMSEMIERYQQAYLREIEKIKAEKKAEREGEKCKSCGQLIIDYS